MNRRTTLLALGGALPLLVTSRALRAQSADTSAAPITPTQAQDETLQYGTLAKATSEIALRRSANTYVKDFARGEIAEQIAVARALTSVAKPPPAKLSPAQQAAFEKVKNAPDATFDSIYLHTQIQGHQSLLQIQNGLLADNLPLTDDSVHIALIAKAFIENHLVILNLLYANNQ